MTTAKKRIVKKLDQGRASLIDSYLYVTNFTESALFVIVKI